MPNARRVKAHMGKVHECVSEAEREMTIVVPAPDNFFKCNSVQQDVQQVQRDVTDMREGEQSLVEGQGHPAECFEKHFFTTSLDENVVFDLNTDKVCEDDLDPVSNLKAQLLALCT